MFIHARQTYVVVERLQASTPPLLHTHLTAQVDEIVGAADDGTQVVLVHVVVVHPVPTGRPVTTTAAAASNGNPRDVGVGWLAPVLTEWSRRKSESACFRVKKKKRDTERERETRWKSKRADEASAASQVEESMCDMT